MIALILHSCYRLAKLGMEDWLQWVIAGACLVVTVVLQAEVAFLFIGAGVIGILYYGSLLRRPPSAKLQAAIIPAVLAPVATSSTLGKLLLFFLKAGSLTFGSGLVIVPFLQQGLVQQYNWLDERQFLIAVAVGMISPGPVVITATFVGYLVAGFCASVDSRNLLSIFSFHSYRGPIAGAVRRQSERAGLCAWRLWGGDQNDSRCLHPPRTYRHRRLAHRPDRRRLAGGVVPVEGAQRSANRRHGRDWTDRAYPFLEPAWVMVK